MNRGALSRVYSYTRATAGRQYRQDVRFGGYDEGTGTTLREVRLELALFGVNAQT